MGSWERYQKDHFQQESHWITSASKNKKPPSGIQDFLALISYFVSFSPCFDFHFFLFCFCIIDDVAVVPLRILD